MHPNDIIADVEKYFRLNAGSIVKHQRTKTYVKARQIAMYLSVQYTDWSRWEIGDMFKRHHTSVTHSYQLIKERIMSDDDIKKIVDNLLEKYKIDEVFEMLDFHPEPGSIIKECV